MRSCAVTGWERCETFGEVRSLEVAGSTRYFLSRCGVLGLPLEASVLVMGVKIHALLAVLGDHIPGFLSFRL